MNKNILVGDIRASHFEKDTSYGSEIVFDESPRIEKLTPSQPKL